MKICGLWDGVPLNLDKIYDPFNQQWILEIFLLVFRVVNPMGHELPGV